MTRPSTIDQLDTKIQAEIGRLRMQGCTIDQIVAHLATMHGVTSVSRSAMGRHVKGLEKVAEQIRRSRDVATALVQQFGDQPESELARLNIEILQGAVLDLKMRAADGEDVAAGGAAALNGDPEGIMMLSKALDHLASAQKKNIDFSAQVEKRAEERARKAAAATVETIGRERGISAATLDAIKAGIVGVKAAT